MSLPNQIEKIPWSLFERIPRVSFWFTCSPLSGYVSKIQKLYGVGPFTGFYIFQDGNLYMYKKSYSLKEAGIKLLEKSRNDNFLLISTILSDIEKGCSNLLEKCQSLKNRQTDENLINFAQTFTHLYEIHSDIWIKGQAINLLEHGHSLIGEELQNKITELGISKGEVTVIIHTLTTSESYSFAQKEEQELVQLAKAMKNENEIETHFKKYSFLGYEWTGPGFSLDYFKQRLELLQKEKNIALYERPEANYRKHVNDEKNKIIAKYNLTNDIIELAKILSRIAYLKSYRVDASWFFYWTIEPYFKKLAKEKSLSFSQIQFLKPTEIADLFSGKEIDPDIANMRKKMYAIYFHDQISEEFFGSKAAEILAYLQQSTKNHHAEVNILQGEAGSPGKANGIVKIIDHSSEMGKMNKGDILVSHTTNPTLVPAMKLAAGIVADIGGVTSHAAIISRELGIPCVTGTKIATQVLKDGDRVEVDAYQGLVTVLGQLLQNNPK